MPRVHCPEERLKAKEVENYQGRSRRWRNSTTCTIRLWPNRLWPNPRASGCVCGVCVVCVVCVCVCVCVVCVLCVWCVCVVCVWCVLLCVWCVLFSVRDVVHRQVTWDARDSSSTLWRLRTWHSIDWLVFLWPCTHVHGQRSPAIRAGKGWRGRRELAPRSSATQSRCISRTRLV